MGSGARGIIRPGGTLAGSDSSPNAGLLERLALLEERHRQTRFDTLRDAVLAGERDAWSRLVEKYSRFVYTVALRMTRGVDGREELTARIYTRTFERLRADRHRLLRNFRGRSRFTTYLYRIVQTERKSFFQEHRRQPLAAAVPLEDDGDPPDPRGPETPVLNPGALDAAVGAALARLEPAQRLLLVSRFRDGLKLRELATLFGFKDTNAAARAVYAALERFDPLRGLAPADRIDEPDRAALAAALRRELFDLRESAGSEA